jgi:hypothetical protein
MELPNIGAAAVEDHDGWVSVSDTQPYGFISSQASPRQSGQRFHPSLCGSVQP